MTIHMSNKIYLVYIPFFFFFSLLVVPNPCESYPCTNGGTCTAQDLDHPQCVCPAGFTGTNCNALIKEDCQDCPPGTSCVNRLRQTIPVCTQTTKVWMRVAKGKGDLITQKFNNPEFINAVG